MDQKDAERGKNKLEQRMTHMEVRLSVLENLIASKKASDHDLDKSDEDMVGAKVKDLGVQECVQLCFGLKGAQTKEQVMNTLDIWGKPYGSWFRGGNFNNRLLKKGILRADGQNEQGQDIYCLTMNGQHLYEKKLEQLIKS